MKSLIYQTADRVFFLPNPDYLLDLSVPATPVANAICDYGDLVRAFADFLNHSQSKLTDLEIFFQFNSTSERDSDATSYNETLLVGISLGTGYAAGTSELLVVALYDETLWFQFDTEKLLLVNLFF